MIRRSAARRSTTRPALALAVLLLPLAGCAEYPERPEPPPQPAEPPPRVAPVDPTVYAAPARGQSPEQQDRDRYECHLWAVKQSQFDPSLPSVPPHQRVRVVAGPPPGSSTVAGAVTGAVLGAAVSNPRRTGEGAVIGAVAGAAIGATADSARAQEERRADERARRVDEARTARIEQGASSYRRAIAACLEGRGYAIR